MHWVITNIHHWVLQTLCADIKSTFSMDAFPTYQAYTAMEVKFERACLQLTILNAKIAEIQLRYDRAAAVNRRSFRYSLRIQLVELEGVRNMYYQYARAKAEELDLMKQQILEALSEESEEEMEC